MSTPMTTEKTSQQVVSSHLREDVRVRREPSAKKKIFSDASYEVQIRIYAGIPGDKQFENDLVTCRVKYLEESLSILIKLWADEKVEDAAGYAVKVVEKLTEEGKGPFHLIRDAKVWCNVDLTKRDSKAISEAGVTIR